MDLSLLLSYSVSLSFGPLFYLAYRFLMPRVSPFSVVGLVLRYALITGTMMMFVVSLLTGPNIRPLDWVHNFLFARTTTSFNSAHVFGYLAIPLTYFVAYYLTGNEYFSLAWTGYLILIGGPVWVAFTFYPAVVYGWTYPWLSSLLNNLVFTSGFVLALRLFRVRWWLMAVPIGVFTAFNALWVVCNGLRYSVTIIGLTYPIVFAATSFYLDPVTNAFEVVGPLLCVPLTFLLLRYVKVERLYGRIREWNSHGWIR
jgi:hypothetical protein